MKLPKIDGQTVKDAVEWLKEEDRGCFHFHLIDTEKYRMHICIGWHDTDSGESDEWKIAWKIAWKIGMETFNNSMQTDLDIDFIMPYDDETGDVVDTLTVIEDGESDWSEIADKMNDSAIETVAWQIGYESGKAV